MREIGTARVFRGQTIRTRADIQRTERVREPSLITIWLTSIAWWAAWLTIMAVWLIVYVPVVGAAIITALTGLILGGGWGLLAVLVALALAARLWSRFRPASFRHHVIARSHAFYRRIRYRWTWDDVCAATGVKATDASHRVIVPRLLWVSLGEHVDQLTVQLCPGVTPGTIARQADALACEWCALEVRVLAHPRNDGWLRLRVVYRDVLAHDPAADDLNIADFREVEVGRREDGQPWMLRLMGTHVLIAGLTGAGKSGVVACIIRALAPAIHTGRVRLIGIDPKGGMEYRAIEPLFYMLAYGTDDRMVAALEYAAELMAARADELGGRGIRKLIARMFGDYPLYVVLIDELLALTTFIADRQLKERANAAIRRMLSQGRAPGVVVVGCVQDPRKEVLSFRDAFGYRVGLRLDSDAETKMVLTDTAYERGAHCDTIPEDCPGMAYVIDEDGGKRQPVKVRSHEVTDAELAWLAAAYPAPERVDVPALTATRQPKRPRGEAGGQAA